MRGCSDHDDVQADQVYKAGRQSVVANVTQREILADRSRCPPVRAVPQKGLEEDLPTISVGLMVPMAFFALSLIWFRRAGL